MCGFIIGAIIVIAILAAIGESFGAITMWTIIGIIGLLAIIFIILAAIDLKKEKEKEKAKKAEEEFYILEHHEKNEDRVRELADNGNYDIPDVSGYRKTAAWDGSSGEGGWIYETPDGRFVNKRGEEVNPVFFE